MSVQEHKAIKGLESQNLRDHMSEAELIFTALAELSTRQIAESTEATGMNENKAAAKTGAASPGKPDWSWKPRREGRSSPGKIICRRRIRKPSRSRTIKSDGEREQAQTCLTTMS